MIVRHLLVFVGVTALAIACSSSAPVTDADRSASSSIRFVERASDAGLTFSHRNGMSGKFYEAEIYAPGVGLLDFDNDGDLDVYVVQGGTLEGPSGTGTSGDRLFRNDLSTGSGSAPFLHFTDVTAESGIKQHTYGMGVATGDVDNDGWVDLYTTRLGQNVLLHNNGDGTFSDATGSSGLSRASGWSVAAAFIDLDRDGWLDLFVTNYLDYSTAKDVSCFSRVGTPDYCDPSAYRPALPRVYHNEHNGRFTEVTSRVLDGPAHGASLGIVAADFNSDGWIDVYVTNDRQENDLWLNQRNGTLRNGALAAGLALNAGGRVEASMGVDAGDFDNDGDEDIFITNFTSEGHTLYLNHGNGTFEDIGLASRLRPASLAFTGFGTAWLDADNDGWLDLFAFDGAVLTIDTLVQAGDPFPLHQRNQFFRNTRTGAFDDVTDSIGPASTLSDVSRGAAFGDIDNDGDMDVVAGTNNGPLRLLLNESPARVWVGLRLLDGSGTRDAVGARVVLTQGSTRRVRRARADGSYASGNDPRVLIGLDRDRTPADVEVTWPDGTTGRWTNVPLERWTTLREGTDK